MRKPNPQPRIWVAGSHSEYGSYYAEAVEAEGAHGGVAVSYIPEPGQGPGSDPEDALERYQHHRAGCEFKFAPLNVCSCVQKNMLDHIRSLEHALFEVLDARGLMASGLHDIEEEIGVEETRAAEIRGLAKVHKELW